MVAVTTRQKGKKKMDVVKYVFGMNYNPVERKDEPYLTEVLIPAISEDEARLRLKVLVGSVMAKNFCLNDVRDY